MTGHPDFDKALDNTESVIHFDADVWLTERTVGRTRIGDVIVSTMRFGEGPPHGLPHFYETWVGGAVRDVVETYNTRANAESGHARWVQRVKDGALEVSRG